MSGMIDAEPNRYDDCEKREERHHVEDGLHVIFA
jgi:hypothetical protein